MRSFNLYVVMVIVYSSSMSSRCAPANVYKHRSHVWSIYLYVGSGFIVGPVKFHFHPITLWSTSSAPTVCIVCCWVLVQLRYLRKNINKYRPHTISTSQSDWNLSSHWDHTRTPNSSCLTGSNRRIGYGAHLQPVELCVSGRKLEASSLVFGVMWKALNCSRFSARSSTSKV